MTNEQKWYLEYKKNPDARIRFFCFHHSGGGASTYYPWISHLSPCIEMVAIQFPGRENRFTDPLNNNLQVIIAQLSKGFALYKNKPFFVFGHSLGALVSFEFIKSLQKLYSISPFHMIVSAAKAPHMPFRMKYLSGLDNKKLKEEVKIYNGIDEDVLNNDELLELFFPIIKNDFSIYENYKFAPTKPFSCNILALSGSEDQSVTLEEIMAWEKYTEGKFEHISFPGKHFFIKDQQDKVLELINRIGNQYVCTSN